MKTGMILYGSLRTFFMKMREYPDVRLCDLFMENIVEPNDPDIFISTDTDDFYYDGNQYFCSNEIGILEGSTTRINDNVKFTSTSEAEKLIKDELGKFLGDRIKGIFIEPGGMSKFDPKFEELKDKISLGAPIANLIGQYRKLKNGTKLLEEFENNFKYDLIAKFRFDGGYQKNNKLYFNKYDFNNFDVYTAGHVAPIVYDWYGFGKRDSMIPYVKLYDNLGFTLPNNTWMLQCGYDAVVSYYGENHPNIIPCKSCGKIDKMLITNITLASEHQIFRTFENLNIRHRGAGYHTWIYRYRDSDKPLSEVMKELNLSNVTVINGSSQLPETIEEF